ncbi:acetyltransferase [Janthinobacterium psychrotolerans]|uniref:Sugar O-acyltransferase, sialic acid O-acetyltransferase NeuD family n=1 Tax=Janthinobacterium psychrotolerans TaxID=1747903 RepID=A0A1A7C4U4_9BURK|nr:acetyltransferase [Janthinobacterium psychrotolerans]OBV40946.1 sugar O-acyltransferase, sialic acid O-acetyltransferase NeuD family [Janthinobacterium psychrotolerans]
MKTIIYGNGSIARLLYSYARHSMDIVGFTVDDSCIDHARPEFLGLPLLAFSQVERHFPPSGHAMLIAVGFTDMNALRARKHVEAEHKGYRFASFVHESVIRHDDATIEDGCIVLDHVSIHPGCRIGRGTFISSNVNLGHDCHIGAYGWINAGISIAGGCHIGEACFFGVNASATHGLRIGARNFIAANTLINRDTLDDQVYLSEPGQLFRLNSDTFLKFAGL